MNKDLFFRTHPLVASLLIVVATFAFLFAMFGLTRWASQGQVIGRVEVAGVPLGGLTEEEALTALLEIQQAHQSRRVTFALDGRALELLAAETGLRLDIDGMLARVMGIGREGNAPYQFLWWFTRILRTETVPVTGGTDPAEMAAIFDLWDARELASPAHHGAIEVNDGSLVAVYPRTGVGIDRPTAAALIEQALLARDPEPVDLPTSVIVPKLTAREVEEALDEARAITGAPITLTYRDNNLTFTTAQLLEAYVGTTVVEGAATRIVHSFDPAKINTHLQPVRSRYEAAPVDARFRIEGDAISIVRGRRGTRIDEEETAQRLIEAAATGARTGELPVVEHADPSVTTESLEAMGIRHLVSSFTTHMDCCQNRVVNIQLMADAVDMAIVAPGGNFNLNAYVGPRTEAKGYLPAGTIINFQLVDTIGGGVSQFATTLYNAVFWGGYQDIEHRPHTQWFSRYPEGIEATVNWGGPELIFRNNTDRHILINTRHTGTSVTVRIFGDNDGRIVKGEQRGGRTHLSVVPGGPNARVVEANVSERFNIREPQPPIYEPDPTYGVDQQTIRQSAREGWSVTVSRRMTRGGEQISYREWVVTYVPQRAIFVVHPCKVPGQEHTCPTTTTTSTTVPENGDEDD